MYKILSLSILFFCSLSVQSQWQERAMKRIDRQVRTQLKSRCLSKTLTVSKAKVSYFFTPKKLQMVKIVERNLVNGATVFKQFFFDKKSGDLISVNMGTTIFYYQSTGYLSVLSSDNFTAGEAEERALKLLNLANKYIKAYK